MPEFNLKTKAPCSPFSPVDKDPPGDKPQGHRGGKASASEEKAQGRKKNRDKKRGGYCECCKIKYSNFKTHLQNQVGKLIKVLQEVSVIWRGLWSLGLPTTIESDVLTKSINVGTQPKGTNTDESFHGSNTFSETGNHLSDEEEARLKTPDSSLVRRIQRKIRVYKHKRRKVDLNIERVESSGVPENSLLKLWDLFQSSDDMDVEFYGF
uniref:DBF4 homolog n=1 Tax=Nothobranchius kadleci TaxID=1051664 RepID=A0A1A8C782_NOTKA